MFRRPGPEDDPRWQRPEERKLPVERRETPAEAKKTATLKSETVIDNWSGLVVKGAGYEKWAMDEIAKYIKEADMPYMTCELMDVYTGSLGAFMGNKRDFLVVNFNRHTDYHMYISARDFGVNLDMSWYLTIEPGFFKRNVSKYMQGDPQALSKQIDIFARQDLEAFVATIHHCCVLRVFDMLAEELKNDPSGINRQSKGFLSVW